MNLDVFQVERFREEGAGVVGQLEGGLQRELDRIGSQRLLVVDGQRHVDGGHRDAVGVVLVQPTQIDPLTRNQKQRVIPRVVLSVVNSNILSTFSVFLVVS